MAPHPLSLQLVENYNSERILRKKYYNIIEDMKGKIRVYCRARPLSGSEKERGNHSVILSPDEYTVQVKTKRGVKEFAYDQVGPVMIILLIEKNVHVWVILNCISPRNRNRQRFIIFSNQK
jgi:hypothetical protein